MRGWPVHSNQEVLPHACLRDLAAFNSLVAALSLPLSPLVDSFVLSFLCRSDAFNCCKIQRIPIIEPEKIQTSESRNRAITNGSDTARYARSRPRPRPSAWQLHDLYCETVRSRAAAKIIQHFRVLGIGWELSDESEEQATPLQSR